MEDFVEGTLRFIGRILAGIFIEFLLELVIKGPGSLILRAISRNTHNDVLELVTGLLFWIFILTMIFLSFL